MRIKLINIFKKKVDSQTIIMVHTRLIIITKNCNTMQSRYRQLIKQTKRLDYV